MQYLAQSGLPPMRESDPVDYRTNPSRYRHWKLRVDGTTATLMLDVAEDGGLRPGYRLKLNSYDLGVDVELHDALNRIRFEQPQVRVVVLTSLKDRVFCSGANIFMLGISSHAWKVNFCKFTNETRNGIEDSSRHSGLRFLAAVNGSCAGGGYELALACDDIVLVDDRSSSVSLPEVPLLGVLPGTGGLTRLTDKRHVRHDLADVFCTTTEGVRGQRALDWRLVDAIARPSEFDSIVDARSRALAAKSKRPSVAQGISLPDLERDSDGDGLSYRFVQVRINRLARTATLTILAPDHELPADSAGIEAAGALWWPLRMGRELDDAILSLRTNEPSIGTWLLRTQGEAARVLACDRTLTGLGDHWLVRETIGLLRRTFARLDVSSRTLFALVETGSCFAGTLLELALAADRTYMLSLPDTPNEAPRIALSGQNFGAYPMVSGQSRLARRFYGEVAPLAAARAAIDTMLDPEQATSLGLVTSAPDDIDWADEIRLAVEERAAMSPDALTGLEANLRFGGIETMESRIFGRLSAWQNWIFNRPSAVGEQGALKVYGKGEKARFDPDRV
jgi:benzoyl-CoA-dihydrodiol lyase